MEIYIDEIDEIDTQNWAFERDYKFNKTLASGAFGIVKSAWNIKSNEEVAIKIIDKSYANYNDITKAKQEITILKQWEHKNIMKFWDYRETNTKLYLVTEYIKDGTLKQWMEDNQDSIDEEKTSKIIYYLLQAVSYIHRKGICHRDIKPENIMLQNSNDISSWKLVDFGLSSNIVESNEFCGTILYMSPELFEKTKVKDFKGADIWSVGIITVMWWNRGAHPFFLKNESKRKYWEKWKWGYKPNKTMSEMSKSFVKKMLEINTSKRYSADWALRHPWITRNINDKIPLNSYENLKNEMIKMKFKELWIGVTVLNYYNKQVKPKYVLTSRYIEKIDMYSSENKWSYKEKKKKQFSLNLDIDRYDTNNNNNNNVRKISNENMKEKTDQKSSKENWVEISTRSKQSSVHAEQNNLTQMKTKHKLIVLKHWDNSKGSQTSSNTPNIISTNQVISPCYSMKNNSDGVYKYEYINKQINKSPNNQFLTQSTKALKIGTYVGIPALANNSNNNSRLSSPKFNPNWYLKNHNQQYQAFSLTPMKRKNNHIVTNSNSVLWKQDHCNRNLSLQQSNYFPVISEVTLAKGKHRNKNSGSIDAWNQEMNTIKVKIQSIILPTIIKGKSKWKK